jgi:uncharacterized repeat protein (TIGR03803 family)
MRCSRLIPLYSTCVFTILISLLSLAQLTQAQTETTIYSFTWGTDGAYPSAGLVMDEDGNLYGTTRNGGFDDLGTVFKITPPGVETMLYNTFSPWRGWGPETALVRDKNGNLYGTTFVGGHGGCNNHSGCGTVFRLKPTGTMAVLHRFKASSEGWGPNGGLVLDSDGNLYGTTVYGGAYGSGTAFEITPDRTERVLHSFMWGDHDGAVPSAGLFRDGAGNLYGTTRYGGPNVCGDGYTCGTVFEVTSSGEEKLLYSFAGKPDGSHPAASLVLDSEANLYGTTEEGGAFGCGTVFEITAEGAEQVLYSFQGGMDGCYPTSNLVRDKHGKLYSTTYMGGAYDMGTVFEVTRAGTKKILHSFSGYPNDGAYPLGALVLDAQRNLYGTTSIGGAHGVGTVFKVTP